MLGERRLDRRLVRVAVAGVALALVSSIAGYCVVLAARCAGDLLALAVVYIAGMDVMTSMAFVYAFAWSGRWGEAFAAAARAAAMSGVLALAAYAAGCDEAARVAELLFLGFGSVLLIVPLVVSLARVYRLLSLRG